MNGEGGLSSSGVLLLVLLLCALEGDARRARSKRVAEGSEKNAIAHRWARVVHATSATLFPSPEKTAQGRSDASSSMTLAQTLKRVHESRVHESCLWKSSCFPRKFEILNLFVCAASKKILATRDDDVLLITVASALF